MMAPQVPIHLAPGRSVLLPASCSLAFLGFPWNPFMHHDAISAADCSLTSDCSWWLPCGPMWYFRAILSVQSHVHLNLAISPWSVGLQFSEYTYLLFLDQSSHSCPILDFCLIWSSHWGDKFELMIYTASLMGFSFLSIFTLRDLSSLIYVCMLKIPTFVIIVGPSYELLTHISSYLLNIFIWVSNEHLKFTMSRTELNFSTIFCFY